MIGALLLLLVLAAVVAGIVLGSRRLSRPDHHDPDGRDGHSPSSGEGHIVRQLFQYLLLFVLVVVCAVGVSGLLEALLARDSALAVTESAIARSVAFTAVGVPLLAVLVFVVQRDFTEDAGAARSLPWVLYASAASIVSLVVALFALHDAIAWALDLRLFDPGALARALVWTAVWAGHWWLVKRQDDQRPLQPHFLVGSLLGLVVGMIGLGGVLAGTLEQWFGLAGESLIVGRHEPVLEGSVTFVLGGAVWVCYWLSAGLRSERSVLWLAYVLLVGVAANLVVTLTASSIALDRVVVWLVGDPWALEAHRFFESMPTTVATMVVGVLALAYHQAVLRTVERPVRTEIDRVRDYLLAAVGLGAATAGATIVVVAFVEAATDPSIVRGGGAGNTLIAALTLLGVGAPVWWFFWRRGQQADPRIEAASPTRRLYLFLLLGLTSLASVGALLAGTWILVEAILQDDAVPTLVRGIRFPVGILVTAAAVAVYHWATYRADRTHAPQVQVQPHGPAFVLLLGVADARTAAAVGRQTGAMVWAWTRHDAPSSQWTEDALVAALDAAGAPEVVVTEESGSLTAIPVSRRPPEPTPDVAAIPLTQDGPAAALGPQANENGP